MLGPPNAQKPHAPSVVPTGSWSHPVIDKIRKSQPNIELEVRRIFTNGIVWSSLALLKKIIYDSFIGSSDSEWWVHEEEDGSFDVAKWSSYAWLVFQALFLWNILSSILRLLAAGTGNDVTDNIGDMPLTAVQRQLMGLDDDSISTSDKKKVPLTPPKYTKNSPSGRLSLIPNSFLSSSSSPSSSNKQSDTSTFRSSPLKLTTKSTLPPAPNSASISSHSHFSPGGGAQSKSLPFAAKTSSSSSASVSKKQPTSSITTPNSKSLATSSIPASSAPVTVTPTFTPTGRYLYMTDSPSRNKKRY